MAGDVLIVKDNLAAETAQEAGHQLSDMPQPDQTHHFAAQFRNGPVVRTLFAPELIAQRIVRAGDVAHFRQNHADGKLRHAAGITSRRVHYLNSARFGLRLINVFNAAAQHANVFKLWQLVEYRRVNRGELDDQDLNLLSALKQGGRQRHRFGALLFNQ